MGIDVRVALNELRRLGIFLRRWGWLMLVGMIVTTGGSVVLKHSSPPVYQSTATIWVSTLKLYQVDPWAPTNGVVSFIQPVIDSDAVLTSVQEKYPDQTIAGLRDCIAVTSPQSAGNTMLVPPVSITVSDGDPQQAAQLANAIAQAVIDFYNNEAQGYKSRAQTLHGQETQLLQQIAKYQGQLQSAQRAQAAQNQIISLQTSIVNAQTQYQTLDTERVLAVDQQMLRQGSVTWLSHAEIPATVPAHRFPNSYTWFAMLTGLFAGFMLALLFSWVDKARTL